MTAVELNGVDAILGSNRVLRSVDLQIAVGELVGIVGPSGAGKSTLLRLIIGELKPSAGTVRVLGRNGGSRPNGVGYVPQIEGSERSFPLTVQGAVELGLAATSRRVPWFGRSERAAARGSLDRLGIGHLADCGLHELSGGQFQRMLFARALVLSPTLFVLDEPTSGIDLQTRAEMLGLLDELRRDGLTIVLTTHDLNWVAAHLPRIVCLNGRVIADGSPTQALTPDNLRETFGATVEVIDHGGRPVVIDPTTLIGA